MRESERTRTRETDDSKLRNSMSTWVKTDGGGGVKMDNLSDFVKPR